MPVFAPAGNVSRWIEANTLAAKIAARQNANELARICHLHKPNRVVCR